MSVHDLSDDQIATARRLYDEGKTLGEVAADLGCSLYDLSPWLYMEHRSVRDAIAAREDAVAASKRADT